MSITIRKIIAVLLIVALVLPLAYLSNVQAQDSVNYDSCQPIVPETPVRGEGQHQVMLIFTVDQAGMATHDKFESNFTESPNPYKNAGASRFIYYVNDGEKPRVPEYSPAVPFRAWLKQQSMKHFSHWAVAQEVNDGSGIQVVPGERFDFNQALTGDVRLVAVYEDILLKSSSDEAMKKLFANYGFTVTVQMPNGDFHVSPKATVTAVEYSATRKDGVVQIMRSEGGGAALPISAEQVPADVVGLQPNQRVTHYEVSIPMEEVLAQLKTLGIPKEYVIYGDAKAQVYGNAWLPKHDDTYVSQKIATTEGFLTAQDKLFNEQNIKYVVRTEKFRRCYGNVYGGNIVVPFARKPEQKPIVDGCQPIRMDPVGPKPEGYHAVTIHFHRDPDGSMSTNDKYYNNVPSNSSQYIYYVKDGDLAKAPERLPIIPHRSYLTQNHIMYFSHWIDRETGERYNFDTLVTSDVNLVAVYQKLEGSEMPLETDGFVVDLVVRLQDGTEKRIRVGKALVNREDFDLGSIDGRNYRDATITLKVKGQQLSDLMKANGVTAQSHLNFVTGEGFPGVRYEVYGHTDLPLHGDAYYKQGIVSEIRENAFTGTFASDADYILKLHTEKYIKCFGNVYGGKIEIILKDETPDGNDDGNGGNDGGSSPTNPSNPTDTDTTTTTTQPSQNDSSNGGGTDTETTTTTTTTTVAYVGTESNEDSGVDYFPPITTTTVATTNIDDENAPLGNDPNKTTTTTRSSASSSETVVVVTTTAISTNAESTSSSHNDVVVGQDGSTQETAVSLEGIDDEDAALGSGALPNTGNLPNELFYAIGAFLLALGALLKVVSMKQ